MSLNRSAWPALALVAAGVLLARPELAGQSSTYGMTIPSSHPRLWWNQERITRARTWFQSNPFTPRTATGDRAFDNSLMFILTGNANYCRTAIADAVTIVDNDPSANSPTEGVASNQQRWAGEQVIVTYDWCHAHLTQVEKDLLRNRWNFYLDNIRRKAWGNAQMHESNYNWGYMRNMMEWGITTYGENSMADVFLNDGFKNRWTDNFVPYASAGGRGGVWQEGSGYGGYPPRYSVIPFMSATLMGRNMFEETNYHRENIYYLVYATSPDRTLNPGGSRFFELWPFADDQWFRWGGLVATEQGFGNFMTTMANHWRNEAAGQYARRWIEIVSPARERHILALDTPGASRDFSNLPFDYYAAGPAYVYGRDKWGPEATTFHLQLGFAHGAGHGHNDLGSWGIWRNGRWLSRESTGYSDSIIGYSGAGVDTKTAAAHNTILVNGTAATVNHDNTTSKYAVRRLESHPRYSYAVTDMSPAFTGVARRVEREFLFLRDLETMVIFDRIDADATKTVMAHFLQNPSVDSGSKIVSAVNGDQALRVTTLLPANAAYRVVTEGGSAGQYRLQIDSAGAGQTYFLNIHQAKDVSAPNLTTSVTDNGSSYTVNLGHPTRGTATIVFQKGASSTGGSVNLAGQNYQLRPNVQSMTVTAYGPTWDGMPMPPASPTAVRIIR